MDATAALADAVLQSLATVNPAVCARDLNALLDASGTQPAFRAIPRVRCTVMRQPATA